MSVTPPPIYSSTASLAPRDIKASFSHHSPPRTASTPLDAPALTSDLKDALDYATALEIGVPKITLDYGPGAVRKDESDAEGSGRRDGVARDIEQPTLVNVFNYTGAVFGKDEAPYEHADFLPSFPTISFPPLEIQSFTDPASRADPHKSRLFAEIKAQGGRIKYMNPAIGADVRGVSLKKLSREARDDLALLVAERGVVFFRKQDDLDIDAQLALGEQWGPLHMHANTGIPRRAGLEKVHVVYADKGARPDPTAFTKPELYHSDVTYELQPPGPTILKLIEAPEFGGDTIFSSSSALYSSFSPSYQKYLDTLYAVHSAKEQAKGARSSGQHVRREPIETVHPVVRVHPTTGLKSIFVSPGFTRRIVGLSKAESDNTLSFLYNQAVVNPDLSCRILWEKNDTAIWQNSGVTHSASFDFWPERRHALRVTPHAEKPMSVAEYEEKTGQPAKDWALERYKSLGVPPPTVDTGATKSRGFKD